MKTVYILTNGFLENGYNYIYMFETKIKAYDFSKFNYLNIKYDLHEIEIPENINNIILFITRSVNSKISVQYIDNIENQYYKIISYYEKEYENENYKNTKIKSNIIFKKNKTILQFFGNFNENSFSIIKNVEYHNSKTID